MYAPVSVVLPHWNRRELLLRLLKHLEGQSAPPEEVIVVDAGSEDGSADAAERRGVRVVRMGGNPGFAALVNAGIRAAHCPWVAIVNNDVTPQPDWLERLLEAAEKEGAWFACGLLLEESRPNQVDGAFDLISRAACVWRAGNGKADGPLWRQPRRVHLPPLTATLLRKQLFDEVGLLDEHFESYLEDVDFGLRCALRGFCGIYVPNAAAYHVGSATLGRWHPETVRRISRNQVFLLAKHWPPGWAGRYGWAVLVGQALWGVLALRHGAAWAWLAGKWEGIQRYRSMRRPWPAPQTARLVGLLEESESELLRLQRQTGFDWYWKLYFSLT